MIVVFFGPPGSGKGTQAQYLVDKYGFSHLSSGNLLRKEIESQTLIGSQVKSLMDKGEYVPDNIVIELIDKVLSNSQSSDFIFDGYPRTLNQALAFDTLLGVKKLKVDLVINFDVDVDLLVKRISGRFSCVSCETVYNDNFKRTLVDNTCDKCGGSVFVRRMDDIQEVYKNRIEIYLKETEAVLDFYRNKNMVKVVDASRSPELIQVDVTKNLVQAEFII